MAKHTAPNRLRAKREAAGLSQTELGAQVGITKQAISQYETGALVPSLTVALAVARALGATVDGPDGLFAPSESNATSDDSRPSGGRTAPRMASEDAAEKPAAAKNRSRTAA